MRRIQLPAKFTIGFDLIDGEIAIVRCDVKYRAEIVEHPEFPQAVIRLKPNLTKSQQTMIRNLCKDVLLPQVLEGAEIKEKVGAG